MSYRIKKRDGPARISVSEEKITTPNILYIDTKRHKAPSFADIVLTDKNKKIPSLYFDKTFFEENKNIDVEDYFLDLKNKDIVVLKYALQLYNQAKKFVDHIIDFKEENIDKTLFIPSVAKPSNLALLAYMGFDLFDSTSCIISARNNVLLFSDGEAHIDDIKEVSCSCPVCNNKKTGSDLDFNDILLHNYHALESEIKQVRNSIKNHNLRNHIEKRITIDPNQIAILRLLDEKYSFLEKNTAVQNNRIIYANTKFSFTRPEIIRFQKRLFERYKKPESAEILVLLPCSAKKPYSFSKSHRYFKNQIFNSKNPNVFHEVIITSPLGIVPRELELVYPAAHYDIPVTGRWDFNEKEMLRTLLEKYLKENKYKKIISHLPLEIMDFIKDIIPKSIDTCVDRPTSDESLEKLSNTLFDKSSKFEYVKTNQRLRENIWCIASYQFGKNTADKLLKGTEIKGKYPFYKIIQNNKQLGMLIQKRGFISLTFEGAKKISDSKSNWVEISDDFELIGSVFAPGIIDADSNIRIGDEVIVRKKNKVCAVGVAMMNGADMKKLSYGEAVKTRHHI